MFQKSYRSKPLFLRYLCLETTYYTYPAHSPSTAYQRQELFLAIIEYTRIPWPKPTDTSAARGNKPRSLSLSAASEPARGEGHSAGTLSCLMGSRIGLLIASGDTDGGCGPVWRIYGRKRWTIQGCRDKCHTAKATHGLTGAARCIQGRGGTGDQVFDHPYDAPASHRRRGVRRAGAAPASHADRHAGRRRGTDAGIYGRATEARTATAVQATTDRIEALTEAPRAMTLGEKEAAVKALGAHGVMAHRRMFNLIRIASFHKYKRCSPWP